jgi:hypothetical protein
MMSFYYDEHSNIRDSAMEGWTPSNDFVLHCNSCCRTNSDTEIIRTSREKYYCLDCLATFDLCQGIDQLLSSHMRCEIVCVSLVLLH